MSGERGSFGHRYWSSLTDVRYGVDASRERNWRGQPFWRRYLASFFVVTLPPRESTRRRQKQVGTARVARRGPVVALPQPQQAPQPQLTWLPLPQEPQQPPQAWQLQRERRPWFLRYQAVVLAGAAVLAAVVVVTTQHPGDGNGNGNPQSGGISSPTPITSSTTGATTTEPPPTSTVASPPPTSAGVTSPPISTGGPSTPSAGPSVWAGSMRVDSSGEVITSSPPPSIRTTLGLTLSGTSTLVGPANVVPLTQDGNFDVLDCVNLLQRAGVLKLTVHLGDQFCMAAKDGSTALARVTAEATDSPGGPYVDLDVTVLPAENP